MAIYRYTNNYSDQFKTKILDAKNIFTSIG